MTVLQSPSAGDAAGRLAHLTVVDIATLAAAPQVAAFFGDCGARVIKVEHPRGDPLRQLVDAAGAALQWKIVNRNKLCVTLDLSQPRGRQLLDRMLSDADLLVSALPPSRLRQWGLDRDQLRRHPRLVAVNLTTFGVGGPWSERPGSGTLAEAATGLAQLTGPAGGPPTLSPVGLGDYLGVLQAIIAALLGLYARDARRGAATTAQFFDVAMSDPLLALLGQRLAQVARTGVDPGRHGNRFPTMAPRNTYRTADGCWVALTAGTDELVRRLFKALGRPELADDPRFRDNRARLAHVDALDALIGDWIGGRSSEEVVARLTAAKISVAAAADLRQVLANPHFRARGNFASIVDAEIGALTTTTQLPEPMPDCSQLRHLGRPLGADNEFVYRQWLGLDAAELEKLRAAGVV